MRSDRKEKDDAAQIGPRYAGAVSSDAVQQTILERLVAHLFHNAALQPAGLALVGRHSFNLQRVRNHDIAKGPLHHRIAVALTFCAVPLVAADIVMDPGGERPSREELLASVTTIAEVTKAGIVTTAKGSRLVGFSFDSTGLSALRSLSDSDLRPYYLHPEIADSLDDIELKVAGTYDEVVRAVATELGLRARIDPTGVIIGHASSLDDLDWIEKAVVLSSVPARQVSMAMDLEVDGKALETPVRLILGMSNWTGFDIGDCPILLVAERIDETGVNLEMRAIFGPHKANWRERLEYSSSGTLIMDKVPCPTNPWPTITLRATVEPINVVD